MIDNEPATELTPISIESKGNKAKQAIFLLLWLWYTLLALISFGSIMSWIFSSLPFDQRKKFIARRLELADVTFKQRNFNVELDEFVREFVKMDGVFVLRMITIHSGVLICTEVVDTMWDQFLAEQGHKVITSLLSDGRKFSLNKSLLTVLREPPYLTGFCREFVENVLAVICAAMTSPSPLHSGVFLILYLTVVDTMWDQFLAEQAEKEDYKGDRAASAAGAQSLDIPLRRKTSVLVPLMSREDLTQMQDHLLRPPSRM
ncbi:hypothetical protein COOONC_07939 [Cooperia oncophora]